MRVIPSSLTPSSMPALLSDVHVTTSFHPHGTLFGRQSEEYHSHLSEEKAEVQR